MPCFTCTSKEGPFQRLNDARVKYIRNVHPGFRDNSYLCLGCFGQFEKIYKLKAKYGNRNRSNLTVSSAASTSVSAISSLPSQNNEATARRTNIDSSESPLRLQFNSRSMDSSTSIDSTDRIVQMVPEILSLRDSSRKTTQNPELNIARHGAEAAVQSVLRRKREKAMGPSKNPVRLRREILQRMDEEESLDDFEVSSELCPNDLAHTGPIVKRRKEPIVHQCDEIMNIYLAGISGG